jgi:hypothetical protein
LKKLADRGPTREAACARFLTRISTLWERLGQEAATYLEPQGNGVNMEFYRNVFEQRLERDLALADDEEFRNRYINGFELIEVPRFRTDAAAWRSFVDSFSRQIHLGSLKAKNHSLIFRRIFQTLVQYGDYNEDVFDDHNELSAILRARWNIVPEGWDGMSVGEYIDCYHIKE